MRTWLILFTCISAIAACGPKMGPLVSPQTPRERIHTQREFRLGTFDVGEAIGDRRELGKVLPAMLLTEQRDGSRCAIYEGGNIRAQSTSAPLDEGNASKYVDGYLSGTFTSVAGGQACLDLRLSNAVTHEVLYARPVCIAIEDTGVDRSAVKRIAEEIARAIKQVGNGKVTSADDRIVFCNKGQEAGVSRGMVAYIVSTGDTVRHPKLHEAVQRYTGVDPAQLATIGTPVIVGEMYIVAVYKEYSVGLLYRGSYALPGDTVFFK